MICSLYAFLLDLKLFEKEIFQIRPILSLTLNNGSGVYFVASCAQQTQWSKKILSELQINFQYWVDFFKTMLVERITVYQEWKQSKMVWKKNISNVLEPRITSDLALFCWDLSKNENLFESKPDLVAFIHWIC